MGRFLEPAAIPGAAGRPLDSRWQAGLHRVRLAVDPDGSLWVAFMHLPIVQKLRPDGTEAWSQQIKVPSLESIVRAVWDQPPSPKFASVGDRNIQLTLVLKDIVADRHGGAFVLLGDNRVLRLRPDGSPGALLIPDRKTLKLSSMAVLLNGDLVAAEFLAGRLFRIPRALTGD
jgi:hypothetical protein